MFGIRLSKASSSVGIEIKDRVIRFVELSSINPLIVKRYGERFISEGLIENGEIRDMNQLKLLIDDCIDTWKLKKKKISFAVSNESVIIKKISTPIEINQNELRGYLYLELGESIHLPFEDPSIDYVVLNETNESRELLIIATPEQTVLSYSSLFSGSKVVPIAADISPLCYHRLYNYSKERTNTENQMLIQVDLSSTTISIFENHVPIFMQYEESMSDEQDWISGDFINGSLEADWNQNETEAVDGFQSIIGVIERILHFYRFTLSEGKELNKILLVGDHPLIEKFSKILSEQIVIPIEFMEKVRDLNGESISLKFQLATGLALKEV